MKHFLIRYTAALFLMLALGMQYASAQVRISGMIVDAESQAGLPSVSVWAVKGKYGAISNETGRFFIQAMPGDTLEFTMVSYIKHDFVVPGISGTFNIPLKRQIFNLGGVAVRGKNHRQDSLSMREEYGKYFDYRRPNAMDVLKTLPSNPITALSYMIPNKDRKRKEAFGKQLQYWEKEKFVDYRYSPELVNRMTKLDGPELDTFMQRYRPSYQFLENGTEYDLLLFIKSSFAKYQQEKGAVRKEELPDSTASK
ncbi:carboxypeptidase-like regulatory domain-containing protein [Chitinophaga horti]|uniref:Carboxypeptidase-like regulatory domain-containing protein n=1 Tax=Chitinophaga horti TaxID=2920382 RepID=A0ABY6J0W1_9BACT|nr:carboxypeptidase-like regulatory domain-containing protein [Chitinophaga horti]UYQ93160.1 carboxypeptidase-like regulatory domain-containing protein [Chitinophaga horti]